MGPGLQIDHSSLAI